MTIAHSLSASDFTELASGAGDTAVIRHLGEAQLSKHLMLLHVVDKAAGEVDHPSPGAEAFRAGYRLLARVQAADPGTVARLLSLPHIGSWAHECLVCIDRGMLPDFGYLAAAAASAAVRAGIAFELDVPGHQGRVRLPGLGYLELPGEADSVRLSSDGGRLRVGGHFSVPCSALLPGDDSGAAAPHWHGTPLVRVEAGGQTWEVLLEAADQYLNRYGLPMASAMTAAEVKLWQRLLQATWELLVRHHRWAAGPVAQGLSVIVPLMPKSDLDSATFPAAFGAIATSLPPTAAKMAETLIHEFQHTKLCGLMDMVPLIQPSGELGYAPWREDPRPVGGILQGLYAYTGIVRFWDVQRRQQTEPNGLLLASVLYERWRLAVDLVAGNLLSGGFLTPEGVQFVTVLKQREAAEPVSAEAREIAREVALDHLLNWQLRHTTLDAAEVDALAAAYLRGAPPGNRAAGMTRIQRGARQVESTARSNLLHLRYSEPRQYQQQLASTDMAGLGAADALLIRGDVSGAVAAYRAVLTAEPDPAAWIGLALAVHRLPPQPVRLVLARRLVALFQVHERLSRRGVHADPLDLAGWVG